MKRFFTVIMEYKDGTIECEDTPYASIEQASRRAAILYEANCNELNTIWVSEAIANICNINIGYSVEYSEEYKSERS